jgi:hypothetical protein
MLVLWVESASILQHSAKRLLTTQFLENDSDMEEDVFPVTKVWSKSVKRPLRITEVTHLHHFHHLPQLSPDREIVMRLLLAPRPHLVGAARSGFRSNGCFVDIEV